MKKMLTRLISAVLIIVLVFSNAPMALGADNGTNASQLSAQTVYNPLYEGLVAQPAATYANRYYSTSESNTEIEAKCTEETADLIVTLRQGMEDRNASIPLYLAVEEPLTNEAFRLLTEEILAGALEETDVPTQGDYLRWSWGSYRCTNPNAFYSYTLERYCYKVICEITYYTTAQQEAELTEAVEEVVDSFCFSPATTDSQKITAIYDYITENVTYDYDNLHDESYTLKFSAYAALMNKTAVCQGYAVLYYRMAEMCGIDTRVIVGLGNDDNHAWNISKLGNYYYYLDATWDEGQSVYNYFLRGRTDFLNHTAQADHQTEAFWARYPIANATYAGEADPNPDDVNYTYQVVNNIAYITGYNGTAKDLIVPAKLGSYPVRYIYESALNGKEFVQTIAISEGIWGIAADSDYMTAQTFAGCKNLKTIYLPTTFNFTYDKYGQGTYIGYTDIPNGCESLEEIIVAPNSPYLKSIDGIVYSQDGKYLVACPQNYQAQTLTIPAGVEEISPTAFAYNNNLETLIFGTDVKTVGFEALMYTKHLTQLQLNDSLQTILGIAFMESSLKSLHLPASVNYLADSALDFMFNVTEITVDPANTTFRAEDGAILSETQLVKYFGQESGSYRVPAGILYISDGAFTDSKLTSVILPEGLYSVGAYAFRDCKNLQHMEIPAGTQMISLGAFNGCDMLATLIVPAGVTMKQSSYDGSTVNGLYLQKNCTIYGEASQGTAPEGWVFIEDFCSANGYTIQPISAFACHNGHNMEKVVLSDNAYEESHDCIYVYRCAVCGCEGLTITEKYQDLSEGKLAFYEATYTGSAITPAVSGVVYDPDPDTRGDEIPLTENVDYTVTYTDNTAVGTAFVRLDGLGVYKGSSLLLYFNIYRIDLDDLEITLQYTSTIFDSTAKFPTVTVEGAKENVDYTVAYHNVEIPGTATVAIRAVDGGNYIGYVEKQFEIIPATETAVQNLTVNFHDYNKIELTWAFDGFIHYNATETGYKVYYKKAADSHYTLADSVVNQEYCTLPLLEANTKYDFKVVKYVRYNDTEYADNEAATATATTLAPLTKPANLTAKLQGTNTAVITWDPVSGAQGYIIYVSYDSGETWYQQWQGAETSQTLQWLSYETEHTFKVVPYQVFNYDEKPFEDVDTVSVTTLGEFTFIFEDGKYYYYAYGEKNTDSGPIYIKDSIYYLENGAWVQENLFVGSGDYFEYYENGIRNLEKTGFVEVEGKTVYVENGVRYMATGLVADGADRYYVVQGEKQTTSGMVELEGVSYYLENGKVAFTFQALSAPEGVTATLSGYNNALLNWSKVSGATHYKVYYRNVKKTEFKLLTTTTATSYEKTGLSSSATYEFKIVPCTVFGSATYTNGAHATALLTTVKILSAPKTVAATLSTYNSATVTWSKVSGATHYKVYYRNVKKTEFKLLTTTTATSYKKTGLSSSATYEFKIVPCISVNGGFYEDSSTKAVQITTAKNLSAPKTVAATLSTYNSATVTWSKVSGATHYKVYYRNVKKTEFKLLTTTTAISYKKTGLSSSATYEFKILPCISVNGGFYEDSSTKAVQITTAKNLSAPKTVTAKLADYNDVKVSWHTVSGAKAYRVYYKKSTAKTYTLKTTTTKTAYTFKNLSSGVKYDFKIVPCSYVNGTYFADDSYKTTNTTTLKKVSTPTVSKKSSKQITVKWSNIAGESGYQISKSTSKTGTSIIATYTTTTGKSKVISAAKGKTYYYKVRAFKTVDGKKIYGPWSNVRAYKLK